jgi:VCBS repeat-containing protein
MALDGFNTLKNFLQFLDYDGPLEELSISQNELSKQYGAWLAYVFNDEHVRNFLEEREINISGEVQEKDIAIHQNDGTLLPMIKGYDAELMQQFLGALFAGKSEVVVSTGRTEQVRIIAHEFDFDALVEMFAPVVSGPVLGAATEDGSTVSLNAVENVSDPDTPLEDLIIIFDELPPGVSYDPDTQTFSLDPSDDYFQSLAKDEQTTVEIEYLVSDGTFESAATAQWVVTGTNDAPTVEAKTIAAMEDGPAVMGAFLGEDNDNDDDRDSLTYAIVDHPAQGGVTNNGDGTFSFDPGDGFQDLAQGETREVSFTYIATDRHGAVSEQATVTVVVTGTNDAPVISVASGDADSALLEETDAGLTTSGTLTVEDVDVSDEVTATVTSVSPVGDHAGQIAPATLLNFLSLAGAVGGVATVIGSTEASGSIGWQFDSGSEAFDFLAAGETLVLSYTIEVSDGLATISHDVTITIEGTNDAPVANPNVIMGIFEAGGVDNSDSGVPTVAAQNVLANDTDVDTPHDQLFVAQARHADGTFVTVGESPTEILGIYGSLFIQADGTTTYELDNDNPLTEALAGGEIVHDEFIYKVSDGDLSDTTTITVGITGANDAPTLAASDPTHELVEQGAGQPGQSTSVVHFTKHDVDGTPTYSVIGWEQLTATSYKLDGTYGYVVLDVENDTLTYYLDDDRPATDALKTGEVETESFTVTITDGEFEISELVQFVVHGSDDAPFVPSALTVVNMVGNFQYGYTDWNAAATFGHIDASTDMATVTRILNDGYEFAPRGATDPDLINGIYNFGNSGPAYLDFDLGGVTIVETFSLISSRNYSNSTEITILGRDPVSAAWLELFNATTGAIGITTGSARAYNLDVTDAAVDAMRFQITGDQVSLHEVAVNESLDWLLI